jgi:predicted nucleotidyltransferase
MVKGFENIDLDNFFNKQPVLKAYLFGSYAREELTPESDLDFLLELDDSANLFQLVSIKLNLEKLFDRSVDVITTNSISPRLKPYIDQDKILIYER